MRWEAWAIVVPLALNALVSISMIGKPRPALTPGSAIVVLVVNGFMVWLVLRLVGAA